MIYHFNGYFACITLSILISYIIIPFIVEIIDYRYRKKQKNEVNSMSKNIRNFLEYHNNNEKYVLILTKGAGELYKLENKFDTLEEAQELGKKMCFGRIEFKDFVVIKDNNNANT